ncbi:hypothetical protein PMAYCL1PPCAC_31139 [Pristionchus mayeri]|uniref:Uncharacterized protein n=1 Tax=Pristionchus mayeri TaxID=1317129 RepID=A0AAN5IDV5_9BILA|nr:hypothetical protein PMAYCL1PPCAC_31139 [Pristionchus mayeri]
MQTTPRNIKLICVSSMNQEYKWEEQARLQLFEYQAKEREGQALIRLSKWYLRDHNKSTLRSNRAPEVSQPQPCSSPCKTDQSWGIRGRSESAMRREWECTPVERRTALLSSHHVSFMRK